jgi:hypothetical protein
MQELNILEEQKRAIEKKLFDLQTQELNKQNRQKAIKSVCEILEKEAINKIYYIDDRFDKDEIKTSFYSKMKDVKNSNINFDEINGFDTIDWHVPMQKFESDISNLWENGNIKELYHNICAVIGDDESSNVVPLLEIKEDFETIVEVFTPDNWQQNRDRIIDELNESSKGLFLFDYEFVDEWRGVNGEKNGVDLAKDIIESDKSDFLYCGIFSHKFSIEQEDEFRRKYIEEQGIRLNKFYTVSKKRYAYDPRLSAFAEGVKNIISLKYIEELKENSKAILEESIKESFKELEYLSPKTFNQIIQKSAKKEGSLEVKELFRIFNVITSFNNHKKLTEDSIREGFNNSISKIHEIDIDTGYSYPDKDVKAIELRNKEIYFSGKIINKLNMPIANGDIFKLGTKEYILLIQPCNLSLRPNGKRNYDYRKAHLVPIRKISCNTIKPLVHQVLESTDNSSTHKYCVEFPKFSIVDLDVLDLVVFNNDGRCLIDMNKNELDNDLIQPHWKKRYEKLYKSYLKHQDAINVFEEVKGHMTDNSKLKKLEPYIKKPYCVRDFSIGQKGVYDNQSKIFDFKIQRVKNYKSPYSTDLLQNFMTYLSRNAFDHDFTNN